MTNERSMMTPDDLVRERLAVVHDAIADIGTDGVTVIAVTKGFDRSAMDCAQRLGIEDVGENYAQELLEKVDAISEGTRSHFMGRVQRNKVRKIAEHVDLWHSVARPEILTEIAKRTPGASVLIQVRPHDDETKDGVRPTELEGMLDLAAETDIEVAGLMTIGVLGDPEATKAAFQELDRLCSTYELPQRSMGMSSDYRDALEAGATMLRLGSVLFGDRPPR